MGSSIVKVGFEASSSPVDSAARQAGASLQAFGDTAGQAFKKVNQAAEETNDLYKRVRNEQEEVERAWIEAVEENARRFKDAEEKKRKELEETRKKTELEKLEHAAQMREFGQSIRESVENPMDAAKKAVEGFVLGLGGIGLGTTAIIALGGAAFEAAEHVAEIAHEAEKLGLELGVDAEKAQLLSRASALMGIDSGAFVTAARKMSQVLVDTSPEAQKLRDKLTEMGISIRDVHTGQLLPFDQVFIPIVKHLSEMKDHTEATRLAVEYFGRGGIAFLAMGEDLD